jgi:hypothetical protein
MTLHANLAYEFSFKSEITAAYPPREGGVLVQRHKRALDTYDEQWATQSSECGCCPPPSPIEALFEIDFATEVYDEALAHFFGSGEKSYWKCYYQWPTSSPEDIGVVIIPMGDNILTTEHAEYENLEFAFTVTVTVSMEPRD